MESTSQDFCFFSFLLDSFCALFASLLFFCCVFLPLLALISCYFFFTLLACGDFFRFQLICTNFSNYFSACLISPCFNTFNTFALLLLNFSYFSHSYWLCFAQFFFSPFQFVLFSSLNACVCMRARDAVCFIHEIIRETGDLTEEKSFFSFNYFFLCFALVCRTFFSSYFFLAS